MPAPLGTRVSRRVRRRRVRTAWFVAIALIALLVVGSVVAFGLPVDGSFAGAGKSQGAASITIVNDAHDTQDFAFTATGDGLSDFVLDDDNDPTRSNTQTFTGLARGTYEVAEAVVPAWKQPGLSCSADDGVDPAPYTATITLAAGEDVTCTFTNSPDRTLVGAVRWDAWNDGPVGREVEHSLGPSDWSYRLPWFAKVNGPDDVQIRGDNQAVADAEITNAADLGVDYFAFVWYDRHAPEGSEEESMSRGLRNYRASPNRDLVKYTIIIRPTRLADPVHMGDLLAYLRDPNWVLVDGRPLIFVGLKEIESRTAIDDLRTSSIAQGTGNPYIVYITDGSGLEEGVRETARFGLDAVSQYAISGGSSLGDTYSTLAERAHDSWNFIAERNTAAVPTLMAGWDPRPRIDRPVSWGSSGNGWYYPATPDELEAHFLDGLEWSRAHEAKAALVYAWNEYDEGGWLGPTLVEDDARLRAVRRAFTSRSGPTITVADATTTEGRRGTTTLSFRVSLSSTSAEPVTVNYTTADGDAVAPTDYRSASGTITFAPGETTRTVSVVVRGDSESEFDETFRVLLQDPENASLLRDDGLGTIEDDDGSPAAGQAETYLSDLTPTSAASGAGPMERDTSNGDVEEGDGNAIRLNGVTSAKGLGVHATSNVTYPLGGQYQWFLADIGVDDECVTAGSVEFQVFVDGKVRYDSKIMTATSATRPVSVNVTGAKQLVLRVTDADDGSACDHADWANARVTAGG